MTEPTRLVAGAMSGTSADGVDVALVEITGRGSAMSARVIHHHAHPFDAPLRATIFAIRRAGSAALRDLAQLAHDLSMAHVVAVQATLSATGHGAAELAAVAAHGQTLFHEPPLTVQWLDPALIAARLGCVVVSDFRRADCAAGGQGAPLVPFADYVLFRHPGRSRVLLNLGGIANLSYIPAGGSMDDVIAFDAGPGNCISDHLCRTLDPSGRGYDAGGERALRGHVDHDLLCAVLLAGYFHRPPPKSTDVPTMIDLFDAARSASPRERSLDDLLATACAFTVETIAQAYRTAVGDAVAEWVVSGGGAHNLAIVNGLRRTFPNLVGSDDLGVDPAAKEALAFALLGAATLDGEPANLPSVTGARRRVVGGTITPRP